MLSMVCGHLARVLVSKVWDSCTIVGIRTWHQDVEPLYPAAATMGLKSAPPLFKPWLVRPVLL
jgi:hypothetical protein